MAVVQTQVVVAVTTDSVAMEQPMQPEPVPLILEKAKPPVLEEANSGVTVGVLLRSGQSGHSSVLEVYH